MPLTKTVQLDLAMHKGELMILLKFPFDEELQSITRQIAGCSWSRTLRAWTFRFSDEALQEVSIRLGSVCQLERKEFSEKLEKHRSDPKNRKLNAEASHKFDSFRKWMLSRRYSESTIGTYCDALGIFLKYFDGKEISQINNDDLIDFNNNYILAKKLSASYQNQVVNAVKLFFRTVENKSIEVESIHRPKRAHVLPNVLSKEEVKKILEAPINLKHRAMLSLIYACGLRRGELLNLKLNDVDSKRKLLIIRMAKGKKDRVAPLSEKVIALLREYFKAYRPKNWLFEGQDKMSRYDERSLVSVLKQSLAKAGINKPVTLHWLRHSYATHLLENGTDLRYIQEILGHSSSRTTEIYTHVSNHSIQKITSPFDTL
jgi:integrase/recombinase XerD